MEASEYRFGWTETQDSCVKLPTLPLAVPRWQTYSGHNEESPLSSPSWLPEEADGGAGCWVGIS